MNSFIFAVNAVAPIIITVAIGYILKRVGLMNADFAAKANKLVFRVFLPVMLFMNLYRVESLAGFGGGYIIYSVAAVAIIFLAAIPLTGIVTRDAGRRGSLLQSTFRSNYALVGIPLAELLFGAEGALVATLLSAVTIPCFNILAVISLSIFGDGEKRPSAKKILVGIAKNPLIISVLSGIAALGIRALLTELGVDFRLSSVNAIYKPMEYLSDLATPLALLVLGAQFEFSAVKELKKEIICGVTARCLVLPMLTLGIAYIFFRDSFGGAEFATLIAVFATPVAVSSVPMAQEMGADSRLAGQLVVWTTLLSSVTVFLSALLLDLGGAFV